MKFKTASGTEYVLTDIEMAIESTGEMCPSVGPQGIPVQLWYTGRLSRVGAPMTDLAFGGRIETTDDFHSIEFSRMPEVGYRFTYYHPVWAGCYSTPVTKIFDEGEM